MPGVRGINQCGEDTMTPLLLASMILTNPDPKAIESPCPRDRFLIMGLHLRRVARDLELLDAQTSQWYFNNENDYTLDIGILREKWFKVKDAPRIWEANRFLSYNFDTSIDLIEAVQWRYQKLYYLRLIGDYDYERVMDDLSYRREMYRKARDATSTYYNIAERREALLWLKNELTPEQWSRGELLPLLPEWLIHEN